MSKFGASSFSKLPQHPDEYDFGSDINEANRILLSKEYEQSQKIECLFNWISRYNPCFFGRVAVRQSEGLSVEICWISESEIELGQLYLIDKIQTARRAWKDKAEKGKSHGFLIFFNSKQLAFAKPSFELLDVCRYVSDIYFIEHAPTETDVIYTEAIPLRDKNENLSIFKAGANIFYPGAHKTRNHDRRIPGGLMISINSPGHYANSLVYRDLASSLSEAIEHVRNLAWLSIGNGGIGDEKMYSTTWHNQDPSQLPSECPMKNRPPYIPSDFSKENYSGLYHTDILSPTSVTIDSKEIDELEGDYKGCEIWKELRIDYLTERRFKPGDRNYALFHGHPISDEAKYHNPWPPIRAVNKPGLTYGYSTGLTQAQYMH
ncbi:hypothetical protein [Synechococcus sp. PCC 7336]|uniref:hypothetical protein n=1 Tax=Synechococcus sp. PCC 7336 TaxID=195250 RepID=UPI000349FFEE|nr:hypothetical protein [Synechococcus sp. PCC 7336]